MGTAPSAGELSDCGSSADGLKRPYQVPNDITPGIDDVRGDACEGQPCQKPCIRCQRIHKRARLSR